MENMTTSYCYKERFIYTELTRIVMMLKLLHGVPDMLERILKIFQQVLVSRLIMKNKTIRHC